MHQNLVEKPIFFENEKPGVDVQNEICPERNEEEEGNDVFIFGEMEYRDEGERECNTKGYQCGQKRKADRIENDGKVGGRKKLRKMGNRKPEGAARIIDKTHRKQEKHRDEKKQRLPDKRKQSQSR